ncbi:putative glycosyltransferase [Acaryochloris thomasi RCC1774]|uniref:Putative glycosyltransferase n=1 Tax=Acaryochloris thomasi RCC1774 TaxID=1764569 RepID=A0A2W1JED8_9CYAN|nr:glycosyltransferase family 2 protein [Acaryochloris thomasi]PZD72056.1 putative glycosyltransferase [Acaryochloris thomasi RCC1774]
MLKPQYSFIVPVFNEEETLPELYKRVSAVMDQMDGPVELVLVNDGSNDRSLAEMRVLRQRDSRVCYVSLARNFGHQTAVTAGLNFIQGQVAVILDADLQDPPELIPEMVGLWQQGYQVVYAQRSRRRHAGWFKRLTAYGFYRILQRLSDVTIPSDTGDFCLLDRQVVDLLNAMPERNRYIRGLRSWVGFRQTAIRFERDSRFAGEVKYTLRKSFALAINSILSFSQVPLRLATYLGLLSASFALIMMFVVLYWRLFSISPQLVGFSIITIAQFFLGAVQLICIGILGEYIGRIYEEVKARPLYTVSEIVGLSNTEDNRRESLPCYRNKDSGV